MISGDDLLQLERRARADGSGLHAACLLGYWQLDQVWPKASPRPSVFSGAMLRAVRARLEIARAESDGAELLLSNAVNLGPLEIRFRGTGHLRGRRPLLQFSFQQLQISLGTQVLLRRTLPPPAAQRLPFFALITRDPSGWLAARGRGGGLALWRLTDPATQGFSRSSAQP